VILSNVLEWPRRTALLIWYIRFAVREVLNRSAMRRMAVLRPLKASPHSPDKGEDRLQYPDDWRWRAQM
jgi:hypothetical protein